MYIRNGNKKKKKMSYFNYNIRKVDKSKYNFNRYNYNRFKILLLLLIIFIAVFVLIHGVKNNEKVEKRVEEVYDHTICIDPGHGGSDTGAEYKNRLEKEDTLKASLMIKKELEKNKIQVILTRDDDKNVSLEDRTNIANTSKSELFISIHRNSCDSGSGIELWVMNDREDAMKLANNIVDELKVIDENDIRGIKEGSQDSDNENYYVNRHTSMPSCIIELGFISNKDDNKLFDKNLNKYAVAISNGIINDLK